MPDFLANEIRVLFEDNHLIAVLKPPGVLTQGDKTGEPSLHDMVKQWLAERYAKPGNVYLGLLHRLDRPVTGVVLFAKTSKAAARLSEQFRQRTVSKIYRARIEGALSPRSGQLVHFHAQSKVARTVRLSDRPVEHAKTASLIYETRWVGHDESLVEVQLETGRKHQIRAQLAYVGHPIVGDRRYGSRRRAHGSGIALCAFQLSFSHPVRKLPLTIQVPEECVPTALRYR